MSSSSSHPHPILIPSRQGLDVLIIITPGNDERVPSTIRMVQAACQAGVAHLIVVSVITADFTQTVFGEPLRFNQSITHSLNHSITHSLNQ